MNLEDKLRQNLEVLQSLGHQNQETINRIVELITKDSNNFEDVANMLLVNKDEFNRIMCILIEKYRSMIDFAVERNINECVYAPPTSFEIK